MTGKTSGMLAWGQRITWFAFLLLIGGPAVAANFSFAILADPHSKGYDLPNTLRLNAAVKWINENAARQNIQFVFVAGDIAYEDFTIGRSGVGKMTLDQLKVPWIPIMGDNDCVYPAESSEFTWDDQFHSQFQVLSNTFANWQKNEGSPYSTENNRNVKLENFSFDYGPIHFLCLDWCDRGDVDSNNGFLHNFTGGTWPFLTNDLATCQKPKNKNIVILEHIPLVTDADHQDFSSNAVVQNLLIGYSNNLAAVYAGHWHTEETTAQGTAYTNYMLNDLWGSDPSDTWLRLVGVTTNTTTVTYAQTDINYEIGNMSAPVGVWHLDEGSGNSSEDDSEYRGPVTNTCYLFNATWTNGVIGSALYFNGTNSYCAISNFSYCCPVGPDILNSNISAITVSAWINTTNGKGAIIDFDSTENWSLGINVGGSTGPGYVSWMTCSTGDALDHFSSKHTVNDGNWHHITATYDSVTGKKSIYIDGLLDAATNAYSAGTRLGGGGTTQRFGFIGVRSSAAVYNGAQNGGFFNGMIDEVRVEPFVLSPEDIARRATLSAGKWNLVEGTGKVSANYADSENPAIIFDGYNPAGWVTNDGVKTLAFDGNTFVVCHNDPGLQLTGDETLSFWVNPSQLGVRMCPVSKCYYGEGEICIQADGSMRYEVGQVDTNTARAYIAPAGMIKTNVWQHVAVVRDSADYLMKVYYNGVLTQTTPLTTDPDQQPIKSGWPFRIGMGTAGYMLGGVDSVEVFAKQLSAGEVAAQYALGVHGLPSPWLITDVGTVDMPGKGSSCNGMYTVTSSGYDISGTGDTCSYMYQPANGDCSIQARVIDLQNTSTMAKAGVMIRETLNGNSQHAACIVTSGNGIRFAYRNGTGGATGGYITNGLAAPYWVRVQRVGNTFTASYSPDSTNWTVMGSTNITMSTNVYIGLAVSSFVLGPAYCSGWFDNVTAAPNTVASTNYNTAGSYQWICPGGVTSVGVECWGAGGGGGGDDPGSGGGGGAGGAYARTNSYAVTAGTTYYVQVGAGGTGGAPGGTGSTNDGGVGGNSWFSNETAVAVLALGGGGGLHGNAGNGGGGKGTGIAGSIGGSATYLGGAGLGGVNGSYGGGGGGSAGTNMPGNTGSSTGAAAAVGNGGPGGAARLPAAVGNGFAPTNGPGGGGGGGLSTGTLTRGGGNGWAGQVTLTYNPPSTWQGGSLVKVIPIIPTTPTNITATASSGKVNLGWPSNYLGWSLQVQTNNLTRGLGTNWVTIPGSQNVTATNFPLSATNGAVFYRLYYQP